jgi:hypothetical protein
MESQKVKPTLSVTLSLRVYRRLKEEVSNRQVSGFVERAIEKELDNHEERLTREQKEFQQKLITDYKRDARSKTLRKEDEIWDEVVEEGIK